MIIARLTKMPITTPIKVIMVISENIVICRILLFIPTANIIPNSRVLSAVIIKKVPNIPKAITVYCAAVKRNFGLPKNDPN